jgi:hypothetical protein
MNLPVLAVCSKPQHRPMSSLAPALAILGCALLSSLSHAAETSAPAAANDASAQWEYGLYMDLSYGLNFNFPDNHRFRSRGTTARANELSPNIALGYLRKSATPDSRWGGEFGLQGGYDTSDFASGQDRPLLGGADTLRHLAYANVTYMAPNGVTVLAGLFDA